ncbi:hypothetical protein [Streptomyces fuscigenes]|uniref:hypothetical protein n=1 Tax=Streptomyces fuscigenes TaxID=1528880 RepID=UPI001F3FC808|nr:hypothetical protein [Streptomyces fuscigenes]MCF3960157.1 hypothetical protein [Streptomyces fuscigenes]
MPPQDFLCAPAAYRIAHNILYACITDLLRHAGMAGRAGRVLFVLGTTSVLSVVVVGTHIVRHLRRLVVASTVVFAAAALVPAVFSGVPALVYVAGARRHAFPGRG